MPNGKYVALHNPRYITHYSIQSVLDVNGDGLSDAVRSALNKEVLCPSHCQRTYSTMLYINQRSRGQIGLVFSGVHLPELTALNSESLRFTDFNGDGLTDIAFVKGDYWQYRLSSGKGLWLSMLFVLVGSAESSQKKSTQYSVHWLK